MLSYSKLKLKVMGFFWVMWFVWMFLIVNFSVLAQMKPVVSITMEDIVVVGNQTVSIPVWIESQDAQLSAVSLVLDFGSYSGYLHNPRFDLNPDGPINNWFVGPGSVGFDQNVLKILLFANPLILKRYQGPSVLIGWLQLEVDDVESTVEIGGNYVVEGDNVTQAVVRYQENPGLAELNFTPTKLTILGNQSTNVIPSVTTAPLVKVASTFLSGNEKTFAGDKIDRGSLVFKVRFRGIWEKRLNKSVAVEFRSRKDTKRKVLDIELVSDYDGVYSGVVKDIEIGDYDVTLESGTSLRQSYKGIKIEYGENYYAWDSDPKLWLLTGDIVDDWICPDNYYAGLLPKLLICDDSRNRITIEDVAQLMYVYSNSGLAGYVSDMEVASDLREDLNFDLRIDFFDIVLVLKNWNDLIVEGED